MPGRPGQIEFPAFKQFETLVAFLVFPVAESAPGTRCAISCPKPGFLPELANLRDLAERLLELVILARLQGTLLESRPETGGSLLI